MGRSYAGILGLLAFVATLASGWIGGGAVESVVRTAWLHLLAFAAAGYLIGQIAGWTVADSVRGRLADELAEQQAQRARAPGNPPAQPT